MTLNQSFYCTLQSCSVSRHKRRKREGERKKKEGGREGNMKAQPREKIGSLEIP